MHQLTLPVMDWLSLSRFCCLMGLLALTGNIAESSDVLEVLPEQTQFGGTSSVAGTLDSDSVLPSAHMTTYHEFKTEVKRRTGLDFGLDYNVMLQKAGESLGEDSAAGGVLRVFGRWTMFGQESGNTGILVSKVENRHRLGTDIAPQDLGFETGYVGLTATPFSDIDWAFTNLFWEQHLFDKRLGFVAGIVDVTDYLNVYGLVDPWTTFSNLAFSTDPAIPAPNQGMGAAISFFPTDRVYILGGLADTNGDPTRPEDSLDSFFSDSEYFSHLEIGLIKSSETRFSDNTHLTFWHADERVEAGFADGWGMAFSFGTLLESGWEPFVRLAYAEDGGAIWEHSASAGFGYHIKNNDDLIGLGINYGRPSESTFGEVLDDQYSGEVFYRFELGKLFTITPDLQILINPAQNPDQDMIAVAGLRIRISL